MEHVVSHGSPAERIALPVAPVAARAGSDVTSAPFAPAWSRPLQAGRVEVWLIATGEHRRLAPYTRVLGSDDWTAIARIKDAAARDHARATRIALRLALTHAAQGAVAPAAWRFRSNSYGKPRVAPGLPQVEFCVSHAGTMSVIAVSRDAPVGIDIETLDSPCEDKLLEAFCSRRERNALAKLGDIERRGAFVRLWTLKEAYAKMTGTGLATDLRYLEFDVDPHRQAARRQAQTCPGGASFQSWLAQAPGGLCQVSVAVGDSTAAEARGKIVCFAVAEDGARAAPRRSCPGQEEQSDLALS